MFRRYFENENVVYFEMGPLLGTIMNAKISNSNYYSKSFYKSYSVDYTENFRPFNLGISLGFGIVANRFLFSGRYDYGLTNVIQKYNRPNNTDIINNNNFNISIGYFISK